jgi:hypothetical protein
MKRHLLVGGFVSLAVSGAAIVACGSSGGGAGNGDDASSGASTFTDVYTQILQPSCGTSSTVTTAGCHQAAAYVPPSLTVSMLDMSSETIAYTNLVNVRGMGTYCSEDGGTGAPFRVLPGNAQESLLYIKVAEAMPPCGVRMPRPIPPASTAEPLTDAQITLIANWINAGALNN